MNATSCHGFFIQTIGGDVRVYLPTMNDTGNEHRDFICGGQKVYGYVKEGQVTAICIWACTLHRPLHLVDHLVFELLPTGGLSQRQRLELAMAILAEMKPFMAS